MHALFVRLTRTLVCMLTFHDHKNNDLGKDTISVHLYLSLILFTKTQ